MIQVGDFVIYRKQVFDVKSIEKGTATIQYIRKDFNRDAEIVSLDQLRKLNRIRANLLIQEYNTCIDAVNECLIYMDH